MCSHSVPPPLLSKCPWVVIQFALADTAEEMSCDVFHFPLEDSRAANNSTAKTAEPKSALSIGHHFSLFLFFHMVHLPILEFALHIVKLGRLGLHISFCIYLNFPVIPSLLALRLYEKLAHPHLVGNSTNPKS